MDNMEEDDHSSSFEEEEVQWFDIKVRRPHDSNAHRRARELLRRNICSTEVFTSTYPQAGDGEDIKLMLKGFRGDSDQAMLSSGLTEWDASDVLCNYLIIHNKGKKEPTGLRLLELGSGLGKCGLVAYHLLKAKHGTNISVLTDGDTNVLKLLRKNVVSNLSSDKDNISCQQLKWGEEEAQSFLSRQNNEKFDIIIGSDLLYTNLRNREPLFETVAVLLDDIQGKFILAHNQEHSVSLKCVKSAAFQKDLFCEVRSIHLLCFRRLGIKSLESKISVPVITKVNDMADRLHAKNTLLEAEIRALKARLELAEDRSSKLDRRCTVLRGGEDLFTTILLSFDEDSLVSILSFLEPQDFASLASTCKRFGAKTHQVDDEDVSLMEKIAYKIYEGASTGEKAALSLYQDGGSAFFLYNELNKLRMPLKFDRLFGHIQYSIEGKSTIQPLSRKGRMKIPSPTAMGRSFAAFTALSDHVMRAGKHYVTFTCTDIGLESNQPIWFGIVRPLKEITPNRGFFTPFCGSRVEGLRELQCPEWGESNIHSCVYAVQTGQCQSTDWGFNNNEDNVPNVTNEDWEGMQTFEGNGKMGYTL